MGDDEIVRKSVVIICFCHSYSYYAIVMSPSKRNMRSCFYVLVIYCMFLLLFLFQTNTVSLVIKQDFCTMIHFSWDVQLNKLIFLHRFFSLHSALTVGNFLFLFLLTPNKRLMQPCPALPCPVCSTRFFPGKSSRA